MKNLLIFSFFLLLFMDNAYSQCRTRTWNSCEISVNGKPPVSYNCGYQLSVTNLTGILFKNLGVQCIDTICSLKHHILIKKGTSTVVNEYVYTISAGPYNFYQKEIIKLQ